MGLNKFEDIKRRLAKFEKPFIKYVEKWPPESGLAFCYWQNFTEEERSTLKLSEELFNYVAKRAFQEQED